MSDPKAREIPGQALATMSAIGDAIANAAKARAGAFFEQLYWLGWDAGRAALECPDLCCKCQEWTSIGRLSGSIRNTAGGWRLVGWRGTGGRLVEPQGHAVNESAFTFCPWCGSGLRPSGNEGETS